MHCVELRCGAGPVPALKPRCGPPRSNHEWIAASNGAQDPQSEGHMVAQWAKDAQGLLMARPARPPGALALPFASPCCLS